MKSLAKPVLAISGACVWNATRPTFATFIGADRSDLSVSRCEHRKEGCEIHAWPTQRIPNPFFFPELLESAYFTRPGNAAFQGRVFSRASHVRAFRPAGPAPCRAFEEHSGRFPVEAVWHAALCRWAIRPPGDAMAAHLIPFWIPGARRRESSRAQRPPRWMEAGGYAECV